MSRYKTVIGIDPDIEKSGYCKIGKEGELSFGGFPFCRLLDLLKEMVGEPSVLVCVEAGWMVQKSNYHKAAGVHRAERIAHDVGENHAVGKLILEYAKHLGLEAIAVHPLKKMWRGPDGKITTEELEQVVGRKIGRCNQDVRDAVLLAWCMSDRPIRINA